jgi:hypothetical protein
MVQEPYTYLCVTGNGADVIRTTRVVDVGSNLFGALPIVTK